MNRLPAMRGFAWISGSMTLIRRQPARLLLIGLVLQFLTGFSQAGPFAILFLMAVPALTAGVLQAMHAVGMGQRPPLVILFSAFSSPVRLLRLFLLSLVMLAAGVLVAGAALSGALDALDPALLARLEQGDMTALNSADPELLRRMLLAVAGGLLVSGTLGYFSIPLVWFRGRSVAAALVASLAAMLRNALPFLLLGLGLFVLAMPLAALLTLLVSSAADSTVLTLLVLILLVAYQLVLFGAQYLSFVDVFGDPPPATPPQAGGSDDQLVA